MPLDLVPLGRLSSVASALWVYGFAGLLLGAPLAWTILRFVRHARAAARAEANEAKPPRLEPGPATLCGTVETADRRPALVLTVVEVRPAPSLFRKSTLTWEERSRKLSPVAGELRRSPTRPMLVLRYARRGAPARAELVRQGSPGARRGVLRGAPRRVFGVIVTLLIFRERYRQRAPWYDEERPCRSGRTRRS